MASRRPGYDRGSGAMRLCQYVVQMAAAILSLLAPAYAGPQHLDSHRTIVSGKTSLICPGRWHRITAVKESGYNTLDQEYVLLSGNSPGISMSCLEVLTLF